MGGVFHRFPELQVKLPRWEWGLRAAGLLSDLVGHTGRSAVGQPSRTLTPHARLDVDGILGYVDEYGEGGDARPARKAIRQHLARPTTRPAVLDEFSRAEVTSLDDIIEPFQRRDCSSAARPTTPPDQAWAFGSRCMGGPPAAVRLFGSDVSHWDVPVMSQVLVEAYEQLEDDDLDADEVPGPSTFASAVRLHGGANPSFFDNTVLRDQAAEVLAAISRLRGSADVCS